MVEAGTANEEVRVYQRDGNSMVRQTTNKAAEVSYAWSYTPEGMVLVGEEGVVTHLDCGADAVYDWSTGLIYKNGGYFDPTLGIWLALTPFVVWQSGRLGRRHRHLHILFVALIFLAACSGSGTPCPAEQKPPVPPDPTFDAAIINSTVTITYGQSDDNGNFVGNPSLGTLTDNGRSIVTHNHFTQQPEVRLANAAGTFDIVIDRQAFEEGIRFPNAQTRQIDLTNSVPEGIPDTASATLGQADSLRVGDSVSVAVFNGGIGVHHAIITAIAWPGPDVPDTVRSAFFDNSAGAINQGDSGGGMFLQGKLIGNTWAMDQGQQEAFSALLP